MKRTTHRTLIGALAVAVTLLVAACGASGGGSDAGKGEKTTTTTAEKATTTTTKASAEDDAQARADSVDLTIEDFPEGWSASAASSDDENSPLEACDPSFSSDEGKLAKHPTDDFSIGNLDQADGTEFSAETVVFADADTADAAVEVFNDIDVVSCVDEALKTFLGDATGLTVDGSLANDDIDLGTDNSAGVSATYVLTSPEDGSTVNATVAVFAFSTGDIGTMATIVSFGDSLDPSMLQNPFTTLAELQGKA